MGKFVGGACAIAAIVACFFFKQAEYVIMVVALVGIIGTIYQIGRNFLGEGLLVALLNIIIIGVIAGATSFGLSFVLPSLSMDDGVAGGAVLMLVFSAIHLIYNSIQWQD